MFFLKELRRTKTPEDLTIFGRLFVGDAPRDSPVAALSAVDAQVAGACGGAFWGGGTGLSLSRTTPEGRAESAELLSSAK